MIWHDEGHFPFIETASKAKTLHVLPVKFEDTCEECSTISTVEPNLRTREGNNYFPAEGEVVVAEILRVNLKTSGKLGYSLAKSSRSDSAVTRKILNLQLHLEERILDVKRADKTLAFPQQEVLKMVPCPSIKL